MGPGRDAAACRHRDENGGGVVPSSEVPIRATGEATDLRTDLVQSLSKHAWSLLPPFDPRNKSQGMQAQGEVRRVDPRWYPV